MMNVEYNFSQHFNYIRERLGNHIYYDKDTLLLSNRLFLRYCKAGNSAQISKLTNGKFRVILCQNKLGCIIFSTFSKFEKCIDFLEKNAFSYTTDALDRMYRNDRLPRIFNFNEIR